MKTMMLRAALACSLLAAASSSFADCAADATVADVQRLYAAAQKFELEGRDDRAFHAYVTAQQYTCDANPVAVPAAQRGAVLGLALGSEAEKNGAFDRAFAIYEEAGQYAAADRALMSLLRTRPDDPSLFERARRTLEDRSSGAFADNNKVRMQAAGSYTPNPKLLVEVLKMPAIGIQRALEKESGILNDDYLSDYVRVVQARPDDPTDAAAVQAAASLQQLFVQKWPGDLLKESRAAIDLARSWATVVNDAAQRVKFEAQYRQRIEQRVALLTKNFNGAPALLETATDYLRSSSFEAKDRDDRIVAVRNLAARLGDTATAKQRFTLAADYYEVAGQDRKADAARERMQQLAMSRMQPQIQQMQQQAEQLRAAYSDPAKVQAMREQALAAKKSLEQQQLAAKQVTAKKTDDLSKELGI